jgi:hypothetical protein
MKKFVKTLLPMILILTICISGSIALIAARTDKISNEFSLMYMDVELKEPSFDNNAVNVYSSNEVIPKDPQITNTGSEEAYVYASVFIPYVSTGYYSRSYHNPGYRVESKSDDIPAYSYTINPGWDPVCVTGEYEYKTVVYENEEYTGRYAFYYYKNPLEPNETTPPLFNEVTFLEYDIDVENAREDNEKAGTGNGSDVLNKRLPIIIQPYAITTDIKDEMLKNYKNVEDLMYDGVDYVNVGPAMAWTYLTKQMNEKYSDVSENEKPDFLQFSTVDSGCLEIYIYDASEHFIDSFVIYSASGDYLDFDLYNLVLKDRGYTPFDTKEEFYDSFTAGYVSEYYPLYVWDWGCQENCTIKDDLCQVEIKFYKDGVYYRRAAVIFWEGELITPETIAAKLEEQNLYFEWSLDGLEINEVAQSGGYYEVQVELSETA